MKWREVLTNAHEDGAGFPVTAVRGTDQQITHAIMEDLPEGYTLSRFVNGDAQVGLRTDEQVDSMLDLAQINDSSWRRYRTP